MINKTQTSLFDSKPTVKFINKLDKKYDTDVKILLLNPPVISSFKMFMDMFPTPRNIVTIAAYLREKGYNNITVKDFLIPYKKGMKLKIPAVFKDKNCPNYLLHGQDFIKVRQWLSENIKEYDIIGLNIGELSVDTPIYEGGYKTARIIREFTDAPIILTGVHASTLTNNVIMNLTTKNFSAYTHWHDDLCFYKLLNGEELNDEYFNSSEFKNLKLDDLPIPAWDLIDLKKYPKFNGKYRGVIQTSRGCPNKCIYCPVQGIFDGYFRAESANKVIRQIEALYDAGARFISFCDDNFCVNIKRAKSICNMIIENKDRFKGLELCLTEGMEVKQAKDPELISLLFDAGFTNLKMGVERLDEEKLKMVGKPYTNLDMFEQAIKNFDGKPEKPKLFYMVGFEDETLDEMLDDLIVLSKYKMPIRVNNVRVYPGTILHDKYYGKYIDDDYDWRLAQFYTLGSNIGAQDTKRVKTLYYGLSDASIYGVDMFNDSIDVISEKLNNDNLKFKYDAGNKIITINGQMGGWFSSNRWRAMSRFLGYRLGFEHAVSGTDAKTGLNNVIILDAIVGVNKKPFDCAQKRCVSRNNLHTAPQAK